MTNANSNVLTKNVALPATRAPTMNVKNSALIKIVALPVTHV